MIKTIIIRLEDSLINTDLLIFKYYEKLWYYLRRHPDWREFEKVLSLREYFLLERKLNKPYQIIADRHLSGREDSRYQQEINMFFQKHLSFYLRLIPGIRTIIKNLTYSYTTVLFTSSEKLYDMALKKYWLDKYFNLTLFEKSLIDATAGFDFFRKTMDKTKSESHETVLISSRLSSDITAGNQLGIITVQTKFDLKSKGIMPQNINERKYFESVTRVPEEPTQPTNSSQIPQAVVEKSGDILNTIKEFESGEPVKKEWAQLKPNLKTNIWDIVKQILIPPMEEE
jgi:FMN phosphatase YigB (HAD superfamily)